MVAFKQIPQNLRVPLFYAEVDNSRANSSSQTMRTLIVGQITGSGTATAGAPVICPSLGEAQSLAGLGSQLALMYEAYRASDSFGEVWLLPLADAAGATAATGTITLTGSPTANGTLALYVGGVLVAQPVVSGQAVAAIATALAATITAMPSLPVTAAAAAGVVTLTAKNKGPGGNEVDLRVNYRGATAGEATPAGLTVAIVAMAGGTTPPTLPTAFAALADQPYDFIVFPYTDATSLDALKALLNDSTGRWSWAQQIYGHGFAAYRGTVGALTTFGVSRNDQHVSILGFYDSPTPAWIVAADFAGTAAVSLRADPGTPLQTLALSTMLAPPIASRFDLSSRNILLWDGISTFNVGADGTCRLENVITTYQRNGFGAADDSYLEIETLFLLAFVLRDLKSVITSKYARKKLAADGTRFGPGANVVTPAVIKADLIARYRELEYDGHVQNGDAFKAGLVVEKNRTNPNRIDVLWPGILINQLRIFALLAQFRLS
ncbi:phage tail sheath subtilisin-like domain-containing protein [Azospirillum sp. TSH64]|uniref:phage tail sheath subtilisin-like domain-containing protein n=1 Tax=Azospirillum sp. TSH64 TaxID=652740 RepID=UPI000D61E8FB|nr:phage tail sheath subtilisin-like domain-containing protein [Azospirillum sp. TSH64]PWC74057.1 phage tail protein [Azospirillum sp. TSH64]